MRFRQANGGNIMSRVMRWVAERTGVLWIAALWLVPVEIPLILPEISLTRPAAAQYGPARTPADRTRSA